MSRFIWLVMRSKGNSGFSFLSLYIKIWLASTFQWSHCLSESPLLSYIWNYALIFKGACFFGVSFKLSVGLLMGNSQEFFFFASDWLKKWVRVSDMHTCVNLKLYCLIWKLKLKTMPSKCFLFFFLTGAKSLKEREAQEGGEICTQVADSYCLQ